SPAVDAVDEIRRHLVRKWRPEYQEGVGCPQPADYPAPIRRRQTRPGINNSTAPGAQLITIAAGDRFAPSKDNGSPPVVVFWSAHPGLQRKIDQATRRAGAPRSQTV